MSDGADGLITSKPALASKVVVRLSQMTQARQILVALPPIGRKHGLAENGKRSTPARRAGFYYRPFLLFLLMLIHTLDYICVDSPARLLKILR